MFQKASTLYF